MVGHQVVQRGDQVVGPVPHHHDATDVHPHQPQLLGQPGTVAIRYPPGQDLGAGDDDPGAYRRAA